MKNEASFVLHIAFKIFSLSSRLSEKSFVLFIQYPPDEGLFLLDWRQF